MALGSVYLMSKVYLWVSGLKWVQNLMTQVYHDSEVNVKVKVTPWNC